MPDDRRFDFPDTDYFVPGEVWTIVETIRERQSDGTFDPAASFTTYSGWEFYVFLSEKHSVGPTAALLTRDALLSLTEGSGITEGTPPEVTIQATATQTAAVPGGGRRWYELWAVVNSERKRLANGTLMVAD